MSLALVLGGGNAVAAYDAGAYEALEQAGHVPDHLAGASAGAITAVLIAGNPPGRRVAALRAFWDSVAAPQPAWPNPWARASQLADGIQARLLGRPGMFRPRLSALANPDAPPGLYDLAPLRATLARLVDLGRLNGGDIRVSVIAVDLCTGEDVVFDTASAPVTLDHVLASAALLPNFPPVAVDGRLLVDGGLAANTPAHLVLAPPRDGLTCFVVDPFPLAAAPPASLLDAQERQSDLIFATQTRRALHAQRHLWSLEARLSPEAPPRGTVWRLEYSAGEDETAIKGFDFGAAVLRRRWDAGADDMRTALAAWGARSPTAPGLTLLGAV
ncbi:MAG: patatin-like phospholipase family protein [Janthinobacterium lividum]